MNRIKYIVLIVAGLAFAHVNASMVSFYPALSPENPAWTDGNFNWYADLYRPYAGIGNPIYGGGLYAKYGFKRSSALLAFDYFSTDMYYRANIGAGLGYAFGRFGIGLSPKIIFDGWHTSDFNYPEDGVAFDPFFANGESNLGFTADFGTNYRARFGTVALLAKNLIPVDMSPSDAARDALEPHISLGYQFPLYAGFVNLGFSYDIAAPDGRELDFAFGYERRIYSIVGLNTSYDIARSLLDAGISINILDNIAVGYAFEYPMTNLGKVSTSHRFAISGFATPPKPKTLPNLTVDIHSLSKRGYQGQDIVLDVNIACYDESAPKPARLVVYANDEIILDQFVELAKDQTEKIVITHTLQDATEFRAIIDYNDEIRESNKDDNVDFVFLDIREFPVSCIVNVTPSELVLRNLIYTYQDHSMVPIVFFDFDSDMLHPRFDFLFDVTAKRLLRNPDVNLKITGFVEPDESHGQLAVNRANAVRDAIMKQFDNPTAFQRRIEVIIPEDTTFSAVPRFGINVGDTAMLQAENRRVEISAQLTEKYSTTVSYNETPSIDWQRVKSMLSRNLGLVLVVATDNTHNDLSIAMAEAFRLKQGILDSLGDGFSHRIYPSMARMNGIANSSEIFLSAEGILYEPYLFAGTRETDPKVIPDAQITMATEGAVAKWKIEAVEAETGRYLGKIASGSSVPPKSMPWDFSSDEGELLPIGRTVALRMIVSNERGLTDTCECAQDISTVIEEKEIFDQKMLLVQFEFDQPAPQSRYLEDRLEIVAGNIVDKIKESKKTDIKISGHTDIIGSTSRNEALSLERAQSVERLLRIIIANIVGVAVDSQGKSTQLDKWLHENNARIETIGYGARKPINVEAYRKGVLQDFIIGDNTLPEGRRINRSVMVEVRGEK